jgi:hypothetical protein
VVTGRQIHSTALSVAKAPQPSDVGRSWPWWSSLQICGSFRVSSFQWSPNLSRTHHQLKRRLQKAGRGLQLFVFMKPTDDPDSLGTKPPI